MEIYVRVLVRSNIVRRQERNINYPPERVLIFPYQPITFLLHTHHYHKKLNKIYYIIFINKISKITSLLNKQNLKLKTKVNQLLPLPFLKLSRMCIQMNFIDKFDSTCTFSFVLFILEDRF